MATTTATRKNGGPGSAVPPRSFPTRQRKLGPAPFASFEDLSDNDTSPPDPESYKLKPMPEIKEDGIKTPEAEEACGGVETGILQFGGVTIIPSTTATTMTSSSSVPTSGPTSGLQTPSTPRIDISCASSSTPPSEESNSERELFPGGLGLAFQEEGADDLRSSTEELLDFGEDEIHEESRRKKEPEDPLRRASHPANLFQRKTSLTPTEDLLHRKPSAHSLYLEGFLSRPCRHSSFGSADRQRPGAISSLSADGRRSASPHKMLLETSFCGPKPIPTPSMDLDSPPRPPKDKMDEPRLYPASTTDPNTVNTGMLSSDSSFESHKPFSLTTLTTVQVHHDGSGSGGGGGGGGGGGSGSTESTRKKNLPPRLVSPDSPKSSDHWFPIIPKSPQLQQQNQQDTTTTSSPPENRNEFSSLASSSSQSSQAQTPAMRRKDHSKNGVGGSPITLTMNKNHNNKLGGEGGGGGGSPSSSSSSTVQNDKDKTTPPSTSSSSRHRSNNNNNNTNNNNNGSCSSPSTSVHHQHQHPASSESGKKATSGRPLPHPPTTASTTTSGGSGGGSSSSKSSSGGKNVAQKEFSSSSKSTKEKGTTGIQKQSAVVVEEIIDGGKVVVGIGVGSGSGKSGKKVKKEEAHNLPTLTKNFDMNDEITTELKITEDAMLPVEDVPMETKGFFQDDSLEDEEDFVYVPTTLPLEKSAVVPIIPIKERRKLGTMVTGTTSGALPRPRCVRPPNPASLNDYIAYSISNVTCSKNNCKSVTKSDEITKMKINLPRDDSIPESSSTSTRPKSPKKKLSTTWTDFAEMGLRSPREIRRKMREENGATDDISSYHSDSSQDNVGPVNGGSDEETETLLKLPNVPFAMDFDVRSNHSQEGAPAISPTSMSSAQIDTQDDNEDDE